jgi:WhiB family redox-sensing transcriptional regulator
LKSMDLYLETHPFNGKQSCKDADPELFFPDDEGMYADLDKAKSICKDCPLTLDCLAYAVRHPELEGVWGGTTSKDRKYLRRRRVRVTT